MWTLRQYELNGIRHNWNLQEPQLPPAPLCEEGGADCAHFLQRVQSFAAACEPLPAFTYSMVQPLVDAAEALEQAVHELSAPQVLRFAVVMAVEDFVKKVMTAKEDLLQCELARKRQAEAADAAFSKRRDNETVASSDATAAADSQAVPERSAEEFHKRDLELGQSAEYAASAAFAVILGCEAAWNACQAEVVWAPADLDLPDD